MNILLTNNISIIEYLYRLTKGEDVKLVMNLSDADAVVVTKDSDITFYNKLVIIPSEKLINRDYIEMLSEVNKVFSRSILDFLKSEDYEYKPYGLVKLKNFKFNSEKNKPMSLLSFKDFIMKKYKGIYSMPKPSAFLNARDRGKTSLVGLIKHQLASKDN